MGRQEVAKKPFGIDPLYYHPLLNNLLMIRFRSSSSLPFPRNSRSSRDDQTRRLNYNLRIMVRNRAPSIEIKRGWRPATCQAGHGERIRDGGEAGGLIGNCGDEDGAGDAG